MRLLEPLPLAARLASNRILFGPIVTNLGDDHRRFTARHTAFYGRRAEGGCGTIVTEGASVHISDWPYERAPLAERCADGWAAIARACHDRGSLVVASLDHAGGQGSSAYSQRELWAPSRVPEVNSREVPKWMEDDDIAAVIDGFAMAAKLADEAGCDGVEINAGQHSLVRQFLSGLTNQRDDAWGMDRTAFARQVIRAVRPATGLLGLRLSGDELAPWAGITPADAPELASALFAEGIDYLVVVRGSIYSGDKTRADHHEPCGYNIDLAGAVRARTGATVIAQGSIVDPRQAESAIVDGAADGIEMTRALLADPDLPAKLVAGRPAAVRPCTRCNQVCQVRDVRNPLISCVGEPSTGHESTDPDWYVATDAVRDVVVVGGGPAGLEAARVAALRGHHVTVVEQRSHTGGMAAVAGPHRALVDWLDAAARQAGATIHTDAAGDHGRADLVTPTIGQAAGGHRSTTVVIQCTGSQAGDRPYETAEGALVIDAAELHLGRAVPDAGDVVIVDPIGGPIAVDIAEQLGERAILVTADHIAGNELSRTGDLAPANVRLAQRGVRIQRRCVVRRVSPGEVVVEDRFSGHQHVLAAVAVIDCGFRIPDPALPGADLQAGDCVAPRTILEAILEGRRAALAIDRIDR